MRTCRIYPLMGISLYVKKITVGYNERKRYR